VKDRRMSQIQHVEKRREDQGENYSNPAVSLSDRRHGAYLPQISGSDCAA